MPACSNCSATLPEDATVCASCGTRVAPPSPQVSSTSGQEARDQVVASDRFVASPANHYQQICAHCGTRFDQLQAVCLNCFRFVGHPKDKKVAVILAVFLGFVTWFYTYERDKLRFWIGAGVFAIGVILSFFIVGFFLILGLWVYAILDTVRQPTIYFENFPAVAHERVA